MSRSLCQLRPFRPLRPFPQLRPFRISVRFLSPSVSYLRPFRISVRFVSPSVSYLRPFRISDRFVSPSFSSARSISSTSSPLSSSSSSKLNLNKFKFKFSSALDRLSCYYTNATSLRCKINELQLLASTSKPHIIVITETWFAESSSVNISGYNVVRRDMASHAGVCVYIYAVILTHVR